jgi:hypothetical protein
MYHAVVCASKSFPRNHPGPGHPDVHPTWIIVVCWLWACLFRNPVAVAMGTLGCDRKRHLLEKMGFSLPPAIPDASTLSRRMQRPDFRAMLASVRRFFLEKLLTPQSCEVLLADSSALDIPTISHDADARWGHHGHFGYRLHTLMSQDKIILEHQALPSNEHELTVIPRLIHRAAVAGVRCRYLTADIGYDSENVHEKTRDWLRGKFIAPPNDRGGTRTMENTPLRRAMWGRWRTRAVRDVRRKRRRIEQAYSVLKGPLGLDSLPRYIRGKDRVRRFADAMTIIYHADLLQKSLHNAIR